MFIFFSSIYLANHVGLILDRPVGGTEYITLIIYFGYLRVSASKAIHLQVLCTFVINFLLNLYIG
jgi:hypothetical protein